MNGDAELERALLPRADETALRAALRVARDRERFDTDGLVLAAVARARAHWNEQDLGGDDLDVGPEVAVLHHRPDADTIERCAPLLRSEDERERYVGLRVLGEIGDVEHGEYPLRRRVRTLLEEHAGVEAHPGLRSLAVSGACNQAFEERGAFLERALGDSDAGVRAAAAYGLFNAFAFERPTAELLARHEPLVRRALADESSDVRWSVVWDIGEYGLLDLVPDSVRADLERLRADPDPLIREDVAVLLDGPLSGGPLSDGRLSDGEP